MLAQSGVGRGGVALARTEKKQRFSVAARQHGASQRGSGGAAQQATSRRSCGPERGKEVQHGDTVVRRAGKGADAMSRALRIRPPLGCERRGSAQIKPRQTETSHSRQRQAEPGKASKVREQRARQGHLWCCRVMRRVSSETERDSGAGNIDKTRGIEKQARERERGKEKGPAAA